MNWGNQHQHTMMGDCDSFTVPVFHRNDDDKLVYIGGRFVPHMDIVSEGVTALKMVTRSDTIINSGSSTKTPTNSYAFNWDYEDYGNDVNPGKVQKLNLY